MKGLVYWLSVNYARRLALQGHLKTLAFNRTLAVDGVSEGINNATHHAFAHVNRCDDSGALYRRTLFNALCRAQKHDTHVVFFEVQNDSAQAVLELYEFARLGVVHSIGAGNTVANLKYGSNFFKLRFGCETR